MKKKVFNKKMIYIILYSISFLLVIGGVSWLLNTFNNDFINLGYALLSISDGLILLIVIINKRDDIIINYETREFISNVKEEICIPLNSIVDFYLYDFIKISPDTKIKRNSNLKLVIEETNQKFYISLKHFNRKTICKIIKELENARDNYEGIFK